MRLFDMHCHLDFLSDATALSLAREAETRGICAFSNTVTPAGYRRARALLGACENVRVGAGLHPWWVAGDDACSDVPLATADTILQSRACDLQVRDLERFTALIRETSFVGEVGLDFAPRHVQTRDEQIAVFDAALSACAAGGKVLSIHAVRSASTVLDMIEARGTHLGNECILHWFSGTSDELTRAIRMGCYFSVNPRMLATKRGRAYVRSIPQNRMLLETDMPAEDGAPYAADNWERDLRAVLAGIAEARNEDGGELGREIAQTSMRLLAMQPQ